MTQIICIDGPAASGKSTVASKLARTLELIHLNSGALFRAVALESRRLEDGKDYSGIAKNLDFKFILQTDGSTKLLINGLDISDQLNSSEVAEIASKIAVFPELRSVLLEVQRNQARVASKGIVVEGRDAGSVVFPEAEFKFYLNASLDERARRRYAELSSYGLSSYGSYQELREALGQRDARDEGRQCAPQKPASDAIIISTDGLSVEQVVELIIKKISS